MEVTSTNGATMSAHSPIDLAGRRPRRAVYENRV